jgi:hypothetical protein
VTDPEVVKDVSDMILLHQVSDVIDYTWGKEIVPHCFSCGYFGDKEDPALHTANIVLEYVEGYYKERFGDERH